MTGLLNPYQQIKVANVLRSYEEDLRMAKSLLYGAEENAILYRKQLLLSHQYYPNVLIRINEALQLIEQLVNELNLPKAEENLAGIVMASMNADWANLLDACSKKLTGFGFVNPELGEVLDGRIDRMANIALELGYIFSKGQD